MQIVLLVILGLSILLQLVAAVLALRLINVTGRKAAWIFIATAVSLMAVRRSITFFQLITGEFAGTLDITAELIALLISILMAAGIAGIGSVFRSINKSNQEKLKSDSWFRAIFDSTFQFIALLKPDGTIVEVNRTALEFSGLKAEDIIGRPFWEAHPWTINPKTQQRLKEAIVDAAHGTFVRYEVDILGAGNQVFTIDFSLKPIRNNNGEVEYLLPEGRDTTERKQAELKLQEREVAYHALLSNLSGMAYRCRNDDSWSMAFVSDACRGITGYEVADLTDNNKVAFGDLVHPDDQEWLWNKCQTCLDKHQPCSNEYRIINASGQVVWVWDQAHGIYSDTGELLAIEGLVTDISDAKMISHELKQERDFSTAVINTIGSVVTVLDRDGRIVQFNKAAQELTGYSLDEVAGREIWDLLLPPEQIGDVKKVFSDLKAAIPPSHYENHWLTRSGEKRLLAWNNSVLLDDDGVVEYVIATGIDITSQKRMEEALRLLAVTASTPDSDSFFRECVGNLARIFGVRFASMGLLSADQKNIRTLAIWAGDGYVDNFDYSLAGTPCEDVIESRREVITQNAAEEYPQDKMLVDMGIQSYFGIPLVSSSGEPYGLLSVMDDKPMELIPPTESLLKVLSIRIATELELKHYFEELEGAGREWTQAMDAFEDAVYLSGTDNILIRANEAFYRVTGLTREQAVGMNLTDIMHPQGEQTPCPVCQARAELRDDHIILEPEGDNRFEKPVEVTVRIIRDSDGNPQRILGTIHDLSRTRKIEENLRRFKNTLDMTLDCVFMFEADTLRFFYLNTGAQLQVGYSEEELLQMTPLDIKPEYDEASFRELLRPLLAGTVPGLQFETMHRHKDGTIIPVEIAMQYINPAKEKARFVAIVRDIKERKIIEHELNRHREHLEELVKARTKELEETRDELVRKERLAALGQLTATVSHELRNPLASMMPSLYLLEKQTDQSNEGVSKAIERLDRSINRCDRIIDDLLDFARIKTLELEPVFLDEWLKGIVEEQPMHPGIKVIQTLTLGDDRVMMDVSHFNRALINVIENACHAMQDGNDPDNDKARVATHNRNKSD